jgi:hypothetical protein
MHYKAKLRRVRVTIVAEEKQKIILQILSVCIVALVMQHANCMRRITLSCVACPVLPFLTVPHKQHDFRKKVMEPKMYVFFLYIISL